MRRADNGGFVARRAIIRWAWRLFRREWRQQVLVLALLIVAVGAAIFSASGAYNIAPVPGNSDFGTVNHFLRFDASDPGALEADVAFAEKQFGVIDAITHRHAPVPGSVETVEFRAQNPNGSYGDPMLALRSGSYPTGVGEVAVTDGLADSFALDIGSSFALDGVERKVVGLVENPSDLSEEFALLDPEHAGSPEAVTILVDAGDAEVFAFRAPSGVSVTRAQRPDNEDVSAALGVFGTATMGLLLVSLVATSSFVVLAQRRLRQLGVLAAIGATEQHLRLVVVANGVIVGAVAAIIGAAIGVTFWIAAVPFIEPAVGHRIALFNVPWWLIGAGMLLAVASATGAAWWPARSVARIPVTLALSGRPPRLKAARRSAALAGLFMAIGLVGLALSDRTNELLIVAGTAATVFSILLISPLAIRTMARLAARSPVAVRLALRDLARYQSRSGAALAAISLALGIAMTTIITATAAKHSASEGNLSDRQILIRIGNPSAPVPSPDFSPFIPEKTPGELENLQAQIDRLAAQLVDATATGLDVAVHPTLGTDPAFGGRPAVTLAEERAMTVDGETRAGWGDTSLLFVATPEMLERYGIDLEAIGPDTEILTVETADLRFTGVPIEPGANPEAVTSIERIAPGYSSLPGSFITLDALDQRGWESMRFGWLIETNEPLTSAQLAAAREIAADAGLTIESRNAQEDLATQRSGATAAGVLLALGILAMTVGLIRSESAGDLRTLTATGATSATRRAITGATAGALGFLGVILGTAGAYLGLAAIYIRDIGNLSPLPVLHLLIISIGVPLSAAAAGWVLAGREPSALSRRALM